MKNRLKVYTLTSFILTTSLLGFVTTPASAEEKTFSIDTEASCITASCNAGMAKKKYIHMPAGEGESCVTCHDVLKDGEHRFKLISEVETLCFNCHDDVVNKKFKHVPVKNGECIMCHDPHQSDNPNN
ncbi:MAG: cytochrome c3 family protein [Candidatus Mariimomonas ferrooxydans]